MINFNKLVPNKAHIQNEDAPEDGRQRYLDFHGCCGPTLGQFCTHRLQQGKLQDEEGGLTEEGGGEGKKIWHISLCSKQMYNKSIEMNGDKPIPL
jgi:hypothetical protein